jgi:hypothetical protein
MPKNYKIEGNIDFFAELYKSLDTDDNMEDENSCLITNEPLTDNFVKLDCGHKFNYVSLYNDIKNHKQKFNTLEGKGTQLKSNEIRCPYCRFKQNSVLPYHEELGLCKIHGVNYIDPNNKYEPCSSYKYKPCEHLTYNVNYDPSGNNPVDISLGNQDNCKFLTCLNGGYYQMSKYNDTFSGENDKYVCYEHKRKILKELKIKFKNLEKLNAKNVKLEAKLKEKEEKEATKLKEKEEKMAAKLKEKEEKQLNANTIKKTKKTKVENQIISSNIVIESDGSKCIEIIKSGTNKGSPCGCKIFKDNLCKRHTKKIVVDTSHEEKI